MKLVPKRRPKAKFYVRQPCRMCIYSLTGLFRSLSVGALMLGIFDIIFMNANIPRKTFKLSCTVDRQFPARESNEMRRDELVEFLSSSEKTSSYTVATLIPTEKQLPRNPFNTTENFPRRFAEKLFCYSRPDFERSFQLTRYYFL
jgi:hypothetical protein